MYDELSEKQKQAIDNLLQKKLAKRRGKESLPKTVFISGKVTQYAAGAIEEYSDKVKVYPSR